MEHEDKQCFLGLLSCAKAAGVQLLTILSAFCLLEVCSEITLWEGGGGGEDVATQELLSAAPAS